MAQLNHVPVSIDRDFARFGNKSFAISKINTVEVKAQFPHGRNGVMLWGLLCTIALLSAAGSAENQSPNSSGAVVGLAFAALFAWLTCRAWSRSNIVEYQLLLVTSSQSVQAIKSPDRAFIEGVRTQIERAVAGQYPKD